MFPSRGCCHGVFLLGHAAKLRKRRSIQEWVQAASERSTFMSRALRLDEIAEWLVKLGLASAHGQIVLANALSSLSDNADRPTLLGIARALLQASPPNWLRFAVRDGRFAREYVPSKDLENLAWMEPDLEQIVLDAHATIANVDEADFLKAMGDAAELLIMAALERAGANPLHVSELSDRYGYDIECRDGTTDRIEVKAASHRSQLQFHISRNEFDKSTLYGREWRLLQVVFSGDAFVSDRLDSSNVDAIRELRPGLLQSLVPTDTETFKWTESAWVSTTLAAWKPAGITLDPEYSVEGFGRACRHPSSRILHIPT